MNLSSHRWRCVALVALGLSLLAVPPSLVACSSDDSSGCSGADCAPAAGSGGQSGSAGAGGDAGSAGNAGAAGSGPDVPPPGGGGEECFADFRCPTGFSPPTHGCSPGDCTYDAKPACPPIEAQQSFPAQGVFVLDADGCPTGEIIDCAKTPDNAACPADSSSNLPLPATSGGSALVMAAAPRSGSRATGARHDDRDHAHPRAHRGEKRLPRAGRLAPHPATGLGGVASGRCGAHPAREGGWPDVDGGGEEGAKDLLSRGLGERGDHRRRTRQAGGRAGDPCVREAARGRHPAARAETRGVRGHLRRVGAGVPALRRAVGRAGDQTRRARDRSRDARGQRHRRADGADPRGEAGRARGDRLDAAPDDQLRRHEHRPREGRATRGAIRPREDLAGGARCAPSSRPSWSSCLPSLSRCRGPKPSGDDVSRSRSPSLGSEARAAKQQGTAPAGQSTRG